MSNLSEDSAISQEPLSYKDSYFPLAKKDVLEVRRIEQWHGSM